MPVERPFVLMIGGFDTSAGAGVLADVKTAEQLNVYALSVLTANTVQTEDTFFEMSWIDIDSVCFAMIKLFDRYSISVVKIGVVPDFKYLEAVVSCVLRCNVDCRIIWDPIVKSSSGYAFFENNDSNIVAEILNKIYLLTPNWEEYRYFSFYQNRQTNILLKGGHRADHKGEDVLFYQDREYVFYPDEILLGEGKHGSGCVLSAAIASYLALGKSLVESCELGKQYVTRFLKSNSSLLGYHNY